MTIAYSKFFMWLPYSRTKKVVWWVLDLNLFITCNSLCTNLYKNVYPAFLLYFLGYVLINSADNKTAQTTKTRFFRLAWFHIFLETIYTVIREKVCTTYSGSLRHDINRSGMYWMNSESLQIRTFVRTDSESLDEGRTQITDLILVRGDGLSVI